MLNSKRRYFAVVPAAGSGSRMGSPLPKQYLPLGGQPLLWRSLATLVGVPRIEAVVVVLSPDDTRWDTFDWSSFGQRVRPLRHGGVTRAASVASGLRELARDARDDDWVLVHDAARACLTVQQVDILIDTLDDDEVGGLLAVPVADTLKRADGSGRVAETVPREGLWQAQTPQMFRYGLLKRAMAGLPTVTDEAGAIEALGLKPKLVPADALNFKITYPRDIELAEKLLVEK